MTLVGRVFSNRYEVQRELARGGMAEVYLARDQLLDRPVALKVLFPEYAREPSFVERFRREAQAAANLSNPNIVGIYDWGQEDSTYFLVMEFLEGRSLREIIRTDAPLEPAQIATIGAEIAGALAAAHRAGVVHRDVKPGNVLITRSGNVKVTDFGIARAGTSDALTQTGSVMGTATYFSPEQAQGLPVDGRSDVYSLGVVMYEMATGVPPFTGDSPVSVAYKHVREDAVPPSARNESIPPDLEKIILAAMAKDPDQRYQSADDLRADLLRFRRGRPPTLVPVTAMVASVATATEMERAAGAYADATVATPRIPAAGAVEEVQENKRKPAIIAALIVVGLAAAIGLILLLANAFAGSEAQVVVPNVKGKPLAEAQKILLDAKLKNEVVTVNDPTVAADTVIAQDPEADKKVRQNSTVKLTVAAGAEQVTIPADIKGKTGDAAKAQLIALGFVVTTRQQPSAVVDKDKVIDTEPPAGTAAPKGSAVTLLVSSGKEAVSVPDVARMSQQDAAQALQAAGFTNVQAVQEESDSIPSGSVIRTDPRAGTKATPDTPIRLFVSSGKGTVTVPLVRGKTLDDARTELRNLGFVVTTLEAPASGSNVGKVISQDPAAGTEARPGSTVVLTIGTQSNPATTAATTTTTSP